MDPRNGIPRSSAIFRPPPVVAANITDSPYERINTLVSMTSSYAHINYQVIGEANSLELKRSYPLTHILDKTQQIEQ